MSDSKLYQSKFVLVSVAGIPIESGLSDGSFVEIERNSDDVESYASVDGEYAFSVTNDKGGSYKVTMAQTSVANQELLRLYRSSELSPFGAIFFPIMVRNVNPSGGGEVYRSAKALLKRLPNVTYAKGVETREWEFVTGCIDVDLNPL